MATTKVQRSNPPAVRALNPPSFARNRPSSSRVEVEVGERGTAAVSINVGQTYAIFNSFEATAPSGAQGYGWGTYTAFPGMLGAAPSVAGGKEGPLFASEAAYLAGTLDAYYYRGANHISSSNNSIRVVRSVNGGRSWQGPGEERAVIDHHRTGGGTFATTAVSVSSNIATATFGSAHTLVVGDWIWTTGLTTNVSQVTPTRVLSVADNTHITYALTAADGPLADGAGTVQLASRSLRGPRCKRFASGRIGLLYSDRDLEASGADLRQNARYRYSDDSGVTWSAPVSLGQWGTNFTFAGAFLDELSDGTLIVSVYAQDTGGGGWYDSLLLESPDTTGSGGFTLRGTMASQHSPAIQFETPNATRLADGRYIGMYRNDLDGMTYRNYSSDDGVTWTTPGAVFPTRRLPFVKQVQNGTIVALASPPTDVGTRDGQLYYSRDSGDTWSGPINYLPEITGYEGAGSDQEEGDLIEAYPNMLFILSGQELVLNSQARLVGTEVGVGIDPPADRHVNAQTPRWQSANGAYADFGVQSYLSGATAFTFETYIRKLGTESNTHQIVCQTATVNGSQLMIHLDSSGVPVVQIATGETTFARYTLTSTNALVIGRTYHLLVRFDGSQATNATRLRVWLNGVEDTTGAYTGTIPASVRTPSPNPPVLQIGGRPNTANQNLRNIALAHARMWPTAIPTGNIAAMYNGRVPLTLAAAVQAYNGGATQPHWSLPLNGNWTDEMGFLAAPTVTGTITFDDRWTP